MAVPEAVTDFLGKPAVSLIGGDKVDAIVLIDPRFTKNAMSISTVSSYILDSTPELALRSEKTKGCH